MSNKPETRSRMTAQSKANIAAATRATLVPVRTSNGNKFKYQVKLIGEQSEDFVRNATGPIEYSSMASAKKAVKTHNSLLEPALIPTI